MGKNLFRVIAKDGGETLINKKNVSSHFSNLAFLKGGMNVRMSTSDYEELQSNFAEVESGELSILTEENTYYSTSTNRDIISADSTISRLITEGGSANIKIKDIDITNNYIYNSEASIVSNFFIRVQLSPSIGIVQRVDIRVRTEFVTSKGNVKAISTSNSDTVDLFLKGTSIADNAFSLHFKPVDFDEITNYLKSIGDIDADESVVSLNATRLYFAPATPFRPDITDKTARYKVESIRYTISHESDLDWIKVPIDVDATSPMTAYLRFFASQYFDVYTDGSLQIFTTQPTLANYDSLVGVQPTKSLPLNTNSIFVIAKSGKGNLYFKIGDNVQMQIDNTSTLKHNIIPDITGLMVKTKNGIYGTMRNVSVDWSRLANYDYNSSVTMLIMVYKNFDLDKASLGDYITLLLSKFNNIYSLQMYVSKTTSKISIEDIAKFDNISSLNFGSAEVLKGDMSSFIDGRSAKKMIINTDDSDNSDCVYTSNIEVLANHLYQNTAPEIVNLNIPSGEFFNLICGMAVNGKTKGNWVFKSECNTSNSKLDFVIDEDGNKHYNDATLNTKTIHKSGNALTFDGSSVDNPYGYVIVCSHYESPLGNGFYFGLREGEVRTSAATVETDYFSPKEGMWWCFFVGTKHKYQVGQSDRFNLGTDSLVNGTDENGVFASYYDLNNKKLYACADPTITPLGIAVYNGSARLSYADRTKSTPICSNLYNPSKKTFDCFRPVFASTSVMPEDIDTENSQWQGFLFTKIKAQDILAYNSTGVMGALWLSEKLFSRKTTTDANARASLGWLEGKDYAFSSWDKRFAVTADMKLVGNNANPYFGLTINGSTQISYTIKPYVKYIGDIAICTKTFRELVGLLPLYKDATMSKEEILATDISDTRWYILSGIGYEKANSPIEVYLYEVLQDNTDLI